MNILSDNSLQTTEKGLDLAIRLPWYRALPLSTVEIGQVRIGGNLIDADKITLGVNGNNYRLDLLAELTGEYWFVLDSAVLHIEYPEARRGMEYDVEAMVTLYPPYIPGIPFPSPGRSRIRAC
jgi:hypothetical protein